jgi:hypothetical protein
LLVVNSARVLMDRVVHSVEMASVNGEESFHSLTLSMTYTTHMHMDDTIQNTFDQGTEIDAYAYVWYVHLASVECRDRPGYPP